MTSETTATDLRLRAHGYRDLASHLEPSGMRESMLDAANALEAQAEAHELVIATAKARIAEMLDLPLSDAGRRFKRS